MGVFNKLRATFTTATSSSSTLRKQNSKAGKNIGNVTSAGGHISYKTMTDAERAQALKLAAAAAVTSPKDGGPGATVGNTLQKKTKDAKANKIIKIQNSKSKRTNKADAVRQDLERLANAKDPSRRIDGPNCGTNIVDLLKNKAPQNYCTSSAMNYMQHQCQQPLVDPTTGYQYLASVKGYQQSRKGLMTQASPQSISTQSSGSLRHTPRLEANNPRDNADWTTPPALVPRKLSPKSPVQQHQQQLQPLLRTPANNTNYKELKGYLSDARTIADMAGLSITEHPMPHRQTPQNRGLDQHRIPEEQSIHQDNGSGEPVNMPYQFTNSVLKRSLAPSDSGNGNSNDGGGGGYYIQNYDSGNVSIATDQDDYIVVANEHLRRDKGFCGGCGRVDEPILKSNGPPKLPHKHRRIIQSYEALQDLMTS